MLHDFKTTESGSSGLLVYLLFFGLVFSVAFLMESFSADALGSIWD